jgi:hypothetical protein
MVVYVCEDEERQRSNRFKLIKADCFFGLVVFRNVQEVLAERADVQFECACARLDWELVHHVTAMGPLRSRYCSLLIV